MKGKDLTPLCHYCGSHSNLTTGAVIYPHRPDLGDLLFWQCSPCGAFVGVHKGTKIPLGKLANAELRGAKMKAHRAFDPIWQSGAKTRKEAYTWLAVRLGIDSKDCHIGEFDVDRCLQVIAICAANPITQNSKELHLSQLKTNLITL